MVRLTYCPISSGVCNQNEQETSIQLDTFFLAEPFKPDDERKRRETTLKLILESQLGQRFNDTTLRIADNEPKEPAIFCGICRMIQSSAYGIADISGLNPNVLIELGMMLAMSKPVIVIFKKTEEASLREKLPSDLLWKRVIPYGECIDINDDLKKYIKNLPKLTLDLINSSPASEVKRIIAEVDPNYADNLARKLQDISNQTIIEFKRLMETAKLNGTLSTEKVNLDPKVTNKLNKVSEKYSQIEKITGNIDDMEGIFLSGNLLANKGQYQKAIEKYDEVLKIDSQNKNAWFNKGLAFLQLKKFKEAVECYDKAIKINPDYRSLGSKGLALSGLGKFREAIHFYDLALELNPNDRHALQNKAIALNVLNRFEEALGFFDRLIAINPKNVECLVGKGFSLSRLGHHEEAIKCYKEALKIKPKNEIAKGNLADELINGEETEEGLQLAVNLAERSKNQSRRIVCLTLSCVALIRLKRDSDFEKTMLKATELLKEREQTSELEDYDFSQTIKTIKEKIAGEPKKKLLKLLAQIQPKKTKKNRRTTH